MKRFLTVALFLCAFTGLSVTAAMSATVQCPTASGCPCEVAQAMQNHSEAMQVASKAQAREIIKQPDNSLGMTCFDHALKLTSRLGQIFSDIPGTGAFPAANERVFGTVYDPLFGTGINPTTGKMKSLANSIETTMSAMMQEHANDFTDSLSNFLGATTLAFVGAFMQPIEDLIATAQGLITSITGVIGTIQSVMDSLILGLDIINTLFPSLNVGILNTTIVPLWNQIKTTLLSAIQTIQTQILSQIVTAITNILNSAVSSILGVDPDTGVSYNDPAKGECSRLSRLWNPVSVTGQALGGDFRPVEGGGVENGTPYLTIRSILQGIAPGAGADYLDEIQNAANSPILTAALNDITTGVLSGPGNMPSWPAAIPTGTFPALGGAALTVFRTQY
ncbi:MAG: hypothetical protein JNM12_03025 [Alphaproteobacteria bacterium]|nr:hypothetical protein [Alphaproteobacteria bacterium]